MNKKIEYWKWKNTIIDFNTISDEKDEYGGYATKKDIVFHYLGTPDNDIHEWYNGGFSSEYNTALRYAKQLGLVEDYIDYEEELYTLKSRINKAIEYIESNPLVISCEYDYFVKDLIQMEELFPKMSFIRTLLERLKGEPKYKLPFDEEVQNGLDSLSIRKENSNE